MASRDRRNDGRLKNGHVDDHCVIEHRTVPFGNACEFLCHFGDLFQVQLRLPYEPGVRSSHWTPCFPVGGRERGRNSKGPARVFHSQSIWTQGDHVRQAGNQSSRRDLEAIQSARKVPWNHNDRLALAHACGLDPSYQLSSSIFPASNDSKYSANRSLSSPDSCFSTRRASLPKKSMRLPFNAIFFFNCCGLSTAALKSSKNALRGEP